MGYGQATRSVSTRPLSALAIAVKVGVEGIGFDVATPLARRINLRGGASFLSYTHSFTEDGIQINPDIKFRKAAAYLDFYPFAGSFRISPGYVFYNGNHATASAMVPGGQTFTLDDTTYTSSTVDPVHGSAEVTFGRKEAPSLTVGWGNMIPRRAGRHFSVPFEIGFEYTGAPKFTYNLAGTACYQLVCDNVTTDPQIQANIKAEQDQLNGDLYDLRFYPIATIGIGYKF